MLSANRLSQQQTGGAFSRGLKFATSAGSSASGLVSTQQRFYSDQTFSSKRNTGGFYNLGIGVVVGQEYAVMLHRFEKFHQQMEPGFNWKIPFIDKVTYVHDLREQVIEIPPQTGVTRDNVLIQVDGVIYLQVTDPVKASYHVENYEEAMINLAQTTMRSEIGKLTLDETFEKRDEINLKVVETIAREADDWGISLLRYEVRDIEPPNQILTSMTLQAEAERSKRAEILGSEGTRQADINIAQAKRQAQILEAEGHQEKQVIVAKAQGEAFKMIETELATVKGKLAAQFITGQRYIQALAQQAKSENLFLVRQDIDNVPKAVHESIHMLDLIQFDGEEAEEKTKSKQPATPIKKTTKKTPE